MRAPRDVSFTKASRQASSAGVSTSSSSVGGSNGTIRDVRLTLVRLEMVMIGGDTCMDRLDLGLQSRQSRLPLLYLPI